MLPIGMAIATVSNGQFLDCDGGKTSYTIPMTDNTLTPLYYLNGKTSNHTPEEVNFLDSEDSLSHLDGVHTVFGDVADGCEHITSISEVQTN